MKLNDKNKKSFIKPLLVFASLVLLFTLILAVFSTTKTGSSSASVSSGGNISSTSGANTSSYNAGYLAGSGELSNIVTDIDNFIAFLSGDVETEPIMKTDKMQALKDTTLDTISNYEEELISNLVTLTFYVDNVEYCTSKAFKGGHIICVPPIPNAPSENYEFGGWYYYANGNLLPEYIDYDTTIFPSDMSLYAEFRAVSQPANESITTLTDTIWQLNSSITIDTQVSYSVNVSCDGYDFSSLDFAYYTASGKFWKGITLDNSYDLVALTETDNPIETNQPVIEFTGGSDVTNTDLITWLNDNATLIVL